MNLENSNSNHLIEPIEVMGKENQKIIHYHKNGKWSDELGIRVFCKKLEVITDVEITTDEAWYSFVITLPFDCHKEQRFIVEIYDKENPTNWIKVTLKRGDEFFLAKNGKIKGSYSKVEEYENNLIDWKNRKPETRASLFLLGFSHLKNKRIVEGIIMLLVEIAFFLFMGLSGVKNLINLVTLGTVQQGEYMDEEGYWHRAEGDNSMHMLLYGVITLVVIALFALFYVFCVRSSLRLEREVIAGKTYSFKGAIKSLANDKLHGVMLAVPLTGILVFTVIPLVYMIAIAFTNYDQGHQPPGQLFDWVGFDNFLYLLGQDANFSKTFWKLFLWTIVWAFFSTFTCFFGGMGLAMLINNKKVKGKVIFRTIFVLTIAIPSFISLLSISTMLQRDGIINMLLQKYGFTSEPLPFLTDVNWARVTVIVVNMWIGVPISMLITTGILLNIPRELFESAKIDGASSWVVFKRIILPYIFFVCTPYLINAFISNVNNFNVIYFLTGGGPLSLDNFKGAGGTDLLVTWLYKLTVDNRDYSYASAIGIIVFLISAGLSLIVYRRSSAKNEGSF